MKRTFLQGFGKNYTLIGMVITMYNYKPFQLKMFSEKM